MEAIRRYVEAEELMTILSLPEQYRNRKLEVIVIPSDEKIEELSCVSDEKVTEISQKLIKQNLEAYNVLAK